MLVRNRIVRAADDGGAGGGAPAADPAPAADAGTAPPAGGEAPVSALADTLLTAEPPKDGEKPTEPPKDGEKPADKAPEPEPEPIKPEDYKLDMPEGINRDDPLVAAFLEGAAKGGMDDKSVQAVISTLGPKLAEQLAAPMKAWTTLNEQWQAEVKADAVLGGANLPATVQTVTDAINLVMAPAEAQKAREALTMTGAGNNPAIVRLLHSMASRLVEKGAVQGNNPAEVRNPSALLYPSTAAKGG